MSKSDGRAVAEVATELLGAKEDWVEPSGYADSLALCALDSVFSLRARYAAVEGVLRRYRAYRRSYGADPEADGGPELLTAIARCGGPEEAAEKLFGNRSKAPGTDVLKAVAVEQGTRALVELGVRTAADLRIANPARRAEARRAWTGVKGLGPISWDYLLMLVGEDGVKADTMVRRFVARATGQREVAAVRARAAVGEAARLLKVSSKALDHAIWRYESELAIGKDA